MTRLIFTFSVPVVTERDRTKTQTARERERKTARETSEQYVVMPVARILLHWQLEPSAPLEA